MTYRALNTPNVQAHYDEHTKLIMLTYLDNLPPNGPNLFYEWLYDLADAIEIGNVHGGIIDIRPLTNFPAMTLGSSVKGAKVLNQRIDLSQLPVAYVVKNLYQREVAQMFVKMAPQANRRAIIDSLEKGLKFIEDWHKANPPEK